MGGAGRADAMERYAPETILVAWRKKLRKKAPIFFDSGIHDNLTLL